MVKLQPVLTLLLGVAVGAAATAWALRGASDAKDFSADQRRVSAPAAVGRTLMARVAGGFVAADGPGEAGGWATFYDRPTAFGDALCRVRRYSLGPSVVGGGLARKNDQGGERLGVEYGYGVWRDPSPGTRSDGDFEAAHAACARYRDFDRLISGDGFSAERTVNILAGAIQDARQGRVIPGLVCRDRREKTEVACDGQAFLRAADVRDIRYVEELDSGMAKPADGEIHRDQADLAAVPAGKCGQGVDTARLTLTTERTYAKHDWGVGDLKALVIERDYVC